MCNASSVVLAEIEGEFLTDLMYSKSLSLPPKLVTDMASLSGLKGVLGDAILPYAGRALFEFLLLLPKAAGVALLGVAVPVSTWAVWVVSERSRKAGHSDPLARKLDDNAGVSG